MSSHLGQRLSALIDGELNDTERDRVLTHLAGCDACREEAVALRMLKQRMHSLGEAMVDAALTGRLMAMAGPGEGRAGRAPRAPWRPRAGYPAARLLTAGILTSAMVGLGATAFLIGGEPQAPGPRVTPAVDTFLLQHAIVTGNMPVAPATPGGASPTAQPTTASGVRSVPVPRSGRGDTAAPSTRSKQSASGASAASGPAAARLQAGALVSAPPTGPADSRSPVPASTASSTAVPATASPGP